MTTLQTTGVGPREDARGNATPDPLRPGWDGDSQQGSRQNKRRFPILPTILAALAFGAVVIWYVLGHVGTVGGDGVAAAAAPVPVGVQTVTSQKLRL